MCSDPSLSVGDARARAAFIWIIVATCPIRGERFPAHDAPIVPVSGFLKETSQARI